MLLVENRNVLTIFHVLLELAPSLPGTTALHAINSENLKDGKQALTNTDRKTHTADNEVTRS